MLQDANQVIEAQLNPGETAVWAGRPRTGPVFRPHDLPIAIFSCACLAIVIYITGTAGSIGRRMTSGGFGGFGGSESSATPSQTALDS